mmetsp:Transcript_122/g.249  ORF Transcript_122/g.249 Transcript_122/m.249 type:complete len:115 (+) Transcript_122:956-1300(+)
MEAVAVKDNVAGGDIATPTGVISNRGDRTSISPLGRAAEDAFEGKIRIVSEKFCNVAAVVTFVRLVAMLVVLEPFNDMFVKLFEDASVPIWSALATTVRLKFEAVAKGRVHVLP